MDPAYTTLLSGKNGEIIQKSVWYIGPYLATSFSTLLLSLHSVYIPHVQSIASRVGRLTSRLPAKYQKSKEPEVCTGRRRSSFTE